MASNLSWDMLLERFSSPGADYRGVPFWSWNSKLSPDEIRQQIRQFKVAGMGGFFMHARVGLATPYLEEEWFDCVKAAIDEADKQGMKAYLYDEDRWPSGAGGGKVTVQEEYRMRRIGVLELDSLDGFDSQLETLAIFTVNLSADGKIYNIRRHPAVPTKLEEGETLLQFVLRVDMPSSWFNDQTYLDTLNPEAVRKFIEITHEAYYREVGEHFGGVCPAIFTDEPSFGLVNSIGGLNVPVGRFRTSPWTGKFVALFKERFGYDILDHLPELFFPMRDQKYSKALYDYMEEITSLFVNSYTRQIGQWCQDHNIASTGHLLYEDTPLSQSWCVGSAMRHYEYMQRPGMDQLSEYWHIYDIPILLASAARQFDRQWRLSEMYGCTGWQFPLAGHKAIGDWQCLLGVNQRCQHLAWYSMRGEAKRDYPAAISRQSPWFNDYSVMEDYFARLNLIQSEGVERRDILVIYPVESAWLMVSRMQDETIWQQEEPWIDFRNALLDRNLGFDYGDEDIISRHGSVSKDGKGAVLKVGHAVYRAVALSRMLTIRESTLALLEEFVAAGGTVVAADSDALPDALNGVEDATVQTRLLNILAKGDCFEVLDRKGRAVRLSNLDHAYADGVLYQWRDRVDGMALTVCNTGLSREHRERVSGKLWQGPAAPGRESGKITVYAPVSERVMCYETLTIELERSRDGQWLELNPLTGEVFLANVEHKEQTTVIHTALEALETKIFLQIPAEVSAPADAFRPTYVAEEIRPLCLQETFEYSMQEPNVAVLDFARWRLQDGPWQEADFILTVDDLVRTASGARCRGGEMVQPWVAHKTEKRTVPLELELEFYCDQIPSTVIQLAMEEIPGAEIRLNDIKVQSPVNGFWVDESLELRALPLSAFRKGRNVIQISCDYDLNGFGLETVFLLGDFGVECRGVVSTLVARSSVLSVGDCTLQGLPNYSGNLLYHTKISGPMNGEDIFLRIGSFGGTAVKVYVNGQTAGVIAFPPYELNLSPMLEQGPNRLEIEVLNTRRNSHGPFYTGNSQMVWVGPGEMKACDRKSRLLVPCGLLAMPELIFRKRG